MIYLRTVLLLATLAPLMPLAAAQPACADDERRVAHALGETCVPEDAARVVTLEWTYTEFALALGVQPVGIADIEGFDTWVKLPEANMLAAGVVDLGLRWEPSLELIAELKPDLIIDVVRSPEIYKQFSAIAPTLVYEPYPKDERVSQLGVMRRDFIAVAGALGKEAEGKAALASLEAKLAAGAEQLRDAGKEGEPFILAQAFSAGNGLAEIRLFGDTAMTTEIVGELGLMNAWHGPFDPYGFSTVGIEGLRDLGDVNFFYVVNKTEDPFAGGTVAPLWETLSFVEAGKAYPVGGDTWLFGGPLSAELLVDNVLDSLAGAVE